MVGLCSVILLCFWSWRVVGHGRCHNDTHAQQAKTQNSMKLLCLTASHRWTAIFGFCCAMLGRSESLRVDDSVDQPRTDVYMQQASITNSKRSLRLSTYRSSLCFSSVSLHNCGVVMQHMTGHTAWCICAKHDRIHRRSCLEL